MTEDEEREIAAAMREAIAKSRGYADYFGWGPDRNLEELGVLQALGESLELEGRSPFYRDIILRGRPRDPPDCEARDADGRRVAVEVTELVSEEAIWAYKSGRVFDFAMWSGSSFLSSMSATIARKDAKYLSLKDPPYEGGYELVVFTDEPMLSRANVEQFLEGHVFDNTTNLSRVILVLGYDPGIQRCPYYDLAIRA